MNSKSYLKFLEWTINMIYKQNMLAPSHNKIVGHICLYSIGVEICLLFSCSFHQSLLGGAGHQYWGNWDGELWGINKQNIKIHCISCQQQNQNLKPARQPPKYSVLLQLYFLHFGLWISILTTNMNYTAFVTNVRDLVRWNGANSMMIKLVCVD